MAANRWKPWEDDIIREHYPSEGSAVYKRLENRSNTAVMCRAQVLGVRFYNKVFPSRPPLYEDVMLEYIDGEITLGEAAILLDISYKTLLRFVLEDEEIIKK